MSIYSHEIIKNEIKFNITEFYTYDNITDYIDNSIHIYQYDESRIRNKSEVLEIENSLGMSFICKNDICTEIDREYMKSFVEIPDKNKNIKRYIRRSFNYNNIKLHKLPNYSIDNVYNCTDEERNNQNSDSCSYYALISFECISDSQCLTNKCIDGYCIYNEENPTEFCTYIYRHLFYYSYSYIHCGKLTGDYCKTNEECASVKCSDGYCDSPPPGPSDSDGLKEGLIVGIVLIVSILFSMFFIVGRYIINFKKEINNNNKIK